MPAFVEWYKEDEGVLVLRMEAPLTWDEYHQAVDAMDEIANKRTARFDVINLTNSAPPKGNPVPHFQRLDKIANKHAQLGLVVTVNPLHSNVIVRTLTSLFAMRQMNLAKNAFAPTLEEAYARIQEHRHNTAPTT
ncbi:MAG: hypothetical protein U0694_07725 [Anaerolineae bacterium]